MYKNMMQGKALTTIFDNLRKFSVCFDKADDEKATQKGHFVHVDEDTSLDLGYDSIAQNMITAMRASGVVAQNVPSPVTYESQIETTCCKLSMIPADV